MTAGLCWEGFQHTRHAVISATDSGKRVGRRKESGERSVNGSDITPAGTPRGSQPIAAAAPGSRPTEASAAVSIALLVL